MEKVTDYRLQLRRRLLLTSNRKTSSVSSSFSRNRTNPLVRVPPVEGVCQQHVDAEERRARPRHDRQHQHRVQQRLARLGPADQLRLLERALGGGRGEGGVTR
jgi:hypothetical protein